MSGPDSPISMTAAAERVRIALVGLGGIAIEGHLPALARSPDVDIAALVDPDPRRRALAAWQAPGVPVHHDVEAVFADDSISAVVLATPPWVTTNLVRESLTRGLFCLAEKPLGIDTATTRTLLELPAAQRGRLQVGLTYRHDPAIATLRRWVEDDELGSPLLIRAHIYDEPRPEDQPRPGYDEAPGDGDTTRPADAADHRARILATMDHGPPIIHEGAHVFDWLTYLLGEPPSRIDDAWLLTTEPGLPSPNLNGARLTWDDGSIALVEVGWWTSAQPRCELSLLGTYGYAVLECATFRLERQTAIGSEIVEFPGDRTSRSFDRQLARFVELVRGIRVTAEPGLGDGLATLELSERIIAAVARPDGPADRADREDREDRADRALGGPP
jgi:myo-inositol 2-dehydrogenase / D-chiro-inositol 1-dehydrogenase